MVDDSGSGGGGSSAAGLVQAGGGGVSALAGALLGMRAQKKAAEIDKIRRQMRRKDYLDQVNESLVNEGEGDKDFDQGLGDAKSELSAHGLAESSAKNHLVEQAKHQNMLRTYALRKHRADLKYGWEKAEQVDKLQRDITRIQQQNAMITAGIDTLTSVGSMAAMCDRAIKRDFGKIDPHEILKRVMDLPITTWRYEWETNGERHLGPMAQDWRDMLGYGSKADGTRIDVVDALGVALTAVQALGDHVATLNSRIQKLEGKGKGK